MTVSFEVPRNLPTDHPPFVEGCPQCLHLDVLVVPLVTVTEGDTLRAFYFHGRCGHQWITSWQAKWAPSWVRVVGPGVDPDANLEWVSRLALPERAA